MNTAYDVYPLSGPDVGPDVEHTSFHVGLCGHK